MKIFKKPTIIRFKILKRNSKFKQKLSKTNKICQESKKKKIRKIEKNFNFRKQKN